MPVDYFSSSGEDSLL